MTVDNTTCPDVIAPSMLTEALADQFPRLLALRQRQTHTHVAVYAGSVPAACTSTGRCRWRAMRARCAACPSARRWRMCPREAKASGGVRNSIAQRSSISVTACPLCRVPIRATLEDVPS